MPSTLTRISVETHKQLERLAKESGQPKTVILDRALELYRRQWILEQSNAAYAGIQADPIARGELKAERSEWDATLADGLENVE